MGVVPSTWAADLFIEAMRLWFYSLVLSILCGLMELWALHWTDIATEKKVAEETEKPVEIAVMEGKSRNRKKRKITKKLVIDGCDLFIPGSATGWMATSQSNVGMLSVASTLLAGSDIWARVNGEKLS